MQKFSTVLGFYIAKYLPLLNAIITALRSSYNLEFKDGHFKSSYLWSAVDNQSNPIPWWSYPAIYFIQSLDLSKSDIFEYGSGNSTIFLSKRCKSITSVEHDVAWQKIIQPKLKKRLHMVADNPQDYSEAINKFSKKYDIIIIDGQYRAECAKQALTHIKSGGFIILDNEDVEPKAAKILDSAGLLKIPFRGDTPIIPRKDTTAIYFKI